MYTHRSVQVLVRTSIHCFQFDPNLFLCNPNTDQDSESMFCSSKKRSALMPEKVPELYRKCLLTHTHMTSHMPFLWQTLINLILHEIVDVPSTINFWSMYMWAHQSHTCTHAHTRTHRPTLSMWVSKLAVRPINHDVLIRSVCVCLSILLRVMLFLTN